MAIKSEESIGLDIGSYSIKVISLGKVSGENTLSAYNVKKIPTGKKTIKTKDLVQEAFSEVDLKPEEVNLSISGPDVIVRFVNLPKMNKEQLLSALAFEAEKYIPFNISEVVLDPIILGDAPEGGQMKVLLAAAKREPIEGMVKMIEGLDMTVSTIDINPCAVFNAFTESNPPEENKGIAFLDLGHSHTDTLIAIGEEPAFMREIRIGGKDITDAISRNLSCPPEKAEEFKMGLGKGDAELVEQTTKQILDDLIKEVQLSFGYFENRYNEEISDVYCSGGMISQAGVTDYLSERLGIKVKVWNPVGKIKIAENLSKEDIDSVASQLAVSIGLALRG